MEDQEEKNIEETELQSIAESLFNAIPCGTTLEDLGLERFCPSEFYNDNKELIDEFLSKNKKEK